MPLTIVDFNNFWSPSGGGVRRYHLEKMNFYRYELDAISVFVMPDSRTYTEKLTDSLIIEHVKAFKFPGKWEYRMLWKKSQIAPILKKYSPDVIEVGSPYLLPSLVRKVAKQIVPKAKLLGFWHADFPITYVKRPITEKFGKTLGNLAAKIAFWYARQEYKYYNGIEVSAEEVLRRLKRNGLPTSYHIPLGCDINMFSPQKRDEKLVSLLKQGSESRRIIFFPHRFCKEKGLDLALKAYPLLEKKLGEAPALVLAGTGPLLPEVLEAAKKFPNIRYVGFISSLEEMARYYASADIGLALSGWETFGLSILESMACGNAQVVANSGAAAEHIRKSSAGLLLKRRSANELADKIAQLLSELNPDLKQSARQYAEKYSWKACFERQLNLYREIVQTSNHQRGIL